jgi:hypothetical protein
LWQLLSKSRRIVSDVTFFFFPLFFPSRKKKLDKDSNSHLCPSGKGTGEASYSIHHIQTPLSLHQITLERAISSSYSDIAGHVGNELVHP